MVAGKHDEPLVVAHGIALKCRDSMLSNVLREGHALLKTFSIIFLAPPCGCCLWGTPVSWASFCHCCLQQLTSYQWFAINDFGDWNACVTFFSIGLYLLLLLPLLVGFVVVIFSRGFRSNAQPTLPPLSQCCSLLVTADSCFLSFHLCTAWEHTHTLFNRHTLGLLCIHTGCFGCRCRLVSPPLSYNIHKRTLTIRAVP